MMAMMMMMMMMMQERVRRTDGHQLYDRCGNINLVIYNKLLRSASLCYIHCVRGSDSPLNAYMERHMAWQEHEAFAPRVRV
jgi:hypothetical protein